MPTRERCWALLSDHRLMSIGEEEAEGQRLTKEALPAARHQRLNFVGNVGAASFSGAVDVIVTDGFTR